ncbi:MAG TPA: hypothetical protein VIY48_06470 [Candidatus Paceibacterota bacterium]
MAIVANLARVSDPVDPAYCTYNRTLAGEPNGSTTPLFVDEMILDTTRNILWKALSLSNNSWVALTGPSI